jgi:hypothetical protein
MAYSDVYLIVIALLVNLRALTTPATIAAQNRLARHRPNHRPSRRSESAAPARPGVRQGVP